MTDVAELADAPSSPAAPRPTRPADRLLRAWRQLTSMRVALILLFLLALVAIPGSVFPQRGADASRVTAYYLDHPGSARWLDRLGMFDVYASPWFAAVYLLLFISLVGCVVPRLRQHLATVRQPPPPAPRNLGRLAFSASYNADVAPDAELARVAAALRGRRWRTVVRGDAVSAEKGFVREWGNLLFHYALVALLIGIACGGLFGYKGSVVLTEGQTFANTPLQYNAFEHGRAVDVRGIKPFLVHLDAFHASYLDNGQPSDFSADVTWRTDPSAPAQTATIGPNAPLGVPSTFVDGPTNVYLIGHGYALHVIVKDKSGTVVYDDTQPMRPTPGDNNLTSVGAVKVRHAQPEQLGFTAIFAPTYDESGTSTFPGATDPRVTLTAYHGDLNEVTSAQTIYELDTSKMTPYGTGKLPLSKTLAVGDTWTLPDGYTATFAGWTNWTQLSVNHDPGKRTALFAAVAMVLG
ncbi:MAG: putative integral rane protein, partial [Frankiales bacterium]|nr:putative integral rane protein [Frankiales bacterium]